MKTPKRMWMGIGLLTAVLLGAFSFGTARATDTSLYISPWPSTITNATYKYSNAKTIQTTITVSGSNNSHQNVPLNFVLSSTNFDGRDGHTYSIFSYDKSNQIFNDTLCPNGPALIYAELPGLSKGYVDISARSVPGTNGSDVCSGAFGAPPETTNQAPGVGVSSRYDSLANPIQNSSVAQGGASGQTDATVKALKAGMGTLAFQDRFTIIGTFNVDGSSQTIKFIDTNITDKKFNYSPQSTSLKACGSGGITLVSVNGDPAYPNFYTQLGKYSAIVASVDLQAKSPQSSTCDAQATDSSLNIDTPANASLVFHWVGDKVESLGNKGGSFAPIASGSDILRGSGTDPCQNVLVLNGNGAGTEYDLTADKSAGHNGDNTSYADLQQVFNTSLVRCYVTAVNLANYSDFHTQFGTIATTNLSIGDKRGASSPTDSATTTTATTCDSSSAWSWAICPVVDAASALTDKLLTLFTDQLSFKVSDFGTSNKVNSGAPSLRLTWTIIKDLASALLVIIGLLMVIGQAIERGPFDAYTVKKVLPRLVVAAIAIQLSWSLTGWVVDLFNDIGKGLEGIMYLAFGSAKNMELLPLLARAHLGVTQMGAFNWAAVGGVLVLGAAFPFTILGVALVAVLSLMSAIVTLIFRKILIIMAMIFAPIAILAWILPGTQKFWKMWQDNLLKALAMFPIAVAIIAAGRIFAFIAATQPDTEFLNLIFVLVGFFGPLFILPKTFKWGGTVMNMAGNGIMKAGNKIGERPKGFLDKRQQLFNEGKAISAADRLKRWPSMSFGQKLGSVARLDQFRSGQLDPTLMINRTMRRERRVKQAKFIAAGGKYNQEEIEAETSALMANLGNYDRGDHDAIRQAIIDGEAITVHLANGTEVEFDGRQRSPAQLQAALDRGVIHGHWRSIEGYLNRAMQSGDQAQMSAATGFLDRNAQAVGREMPHLLKGLNIAATSRPEAIVSMRQEEVESILANLHNRALNAVDPLTGAPDMAARQQAAANLSVFLRNYATAVTDPRLRSQLDQGGARVVKAFVDNNAVELTRVNHDPDAGRVDRYGLNPVDPLATVQPAMVAAIAADPTVVAATANAVTSISHAISTEGVIS